MKNKLTIFLCIFTMLLMGQEQYKITYLKYSNGKLIENQDPIVVLANPSFNCIVSQKILENNISFPSEYMVVDTKKFHLNQYAKLNFQQTIKSIDSTSIKKQNLILQTDTKKIAGYHCKKATTIINSNHIEIWYTTEIGLHGSPSSLGQQLGMVLEINRNGNTVTQATKVEKIKKNLFSIDKQTKNVDMLTYKDLVWKSRFATIPLFKDEVICFSDDAKSNDSILRFANGTIILKKIKFPKIANGNQVFIDLQEQSNGDAYDRTGSVFAIVNSEISYLKGLQEGIKQLPFYENGNQKKYQGVVKTETYTPLLELMRFFTPFGIKQYNYLQLKDKTWEDQVNYRQDISSIASFLSEKEIYIGAFIGNYDKGGHKISSQITIHKEEEVEKPNFVLPIFNTTNVMEMAGQEYGTMFHSAKGLISKFYLENDLLNAQLRYITTGHGGWEHGDEFVPKKNTIFLDNKEVFHFTPWREDCGAYRLYNPASGNFENGLSSSDYSRANWCPGTATNPIYIDLGNLKAGKHSIQIVIPQGETEGNSFSSWNVSGVLIGTKP